MVLEGRDCVELLQQIKAAQAALDQVAIGLIGDLVADPAFWHEGPSRQARLEELLAATERLVSPHGRRDPGQGTNPDRDR